MRPLSARRRKLLFALVPSVIIFFLFGLGFLVGYQVALRPLRKAMRSSDAAASLGNLLESDRREAAAAAYHSPQEALAYFDRICWGVPNVLTPFVGSGPWPGKNENAFINRLQFRDTREPVTPKPQGTYRIFFTGGSTAFGSGAPDQGRTIGAYLEAILEKELGPSSGKHFEVFTAANPGWASTQERIIIENRLSELEPDLVLSFSGNNDVHWGAQGRNVLWFRTYADEHFFHLANVLYRYFGHPLMPDVVESSKEPVPPPLVALRMAKNVRLAAQALAGTPARYIFLLQPTLAVTRKPLNSGERRSLNDKREYFSACYGEIDRQLRELHLDTFVFLSLTDVFDGLPESETVFIDSYHFGDKGNELVASEIYKRLFSLPGPWR